MNADNFISDLAAADLIAQFPIAESTVTDEYQSTVNVLSNGDTLIHYCDPNKPLGWEHDPAPAGSQTVAAPLEGANAPAPLPVATATAVPAPAAAEPVPAAPAV